MSLSPDDFGASFKGFIDQMSASAPVEEPEFRTRLAAHFGQKPDTLPTLTQEFAVHDHANLHLAIESELSSLNCPVELLGITSAYEHLGVTLSTLAAPGKSGRWGGPAPHEGPVEYVNIALDEDRVIACVQSGLYLAQRENEPLAILMRGPSKRYHPMAGVGVEVMAGRREAAEQFLADVRTAMRRRNVYRGHIVSITGMAMGGIEVKFHRLPTVKRDNIILPAGLLERIERQTVRFSELSDRLAASRRHLKRGILLHGAPGTGKTLIAMYIAQAMLQRTVLLLTGSDQRWIEPSCAMARALQPSVVILEDVDLVAEERTLRGAACATPLLFELLNQMDGLAEDADVLFLLTSNRPEILEPALASRPGRVDQAIEIPLPDADCRRRLFELYADGLTLRSVNLESCIQRTEGASAAFIRELMRKAALFGIDEGSDAVEDRHLHEALHELVVDGGSLTKSLLGFASPS